MGILLIGPEFLVSSNLLWRKQSGQSGGFLVVNARFFSADFLEWKFAREARDGHLGAGIGVAHDDVAGLLLLLRREGELF